MRTRIFQIHKRSSETFEEIQDKYSIDLDNKIYSLSDGATQGYKSEIWAEILTKTFIENPTFNGKDFLRNITDAAANFSKIEFEYSDNFAIKALQKRKEEQGSFATFLGIQLNGNVVNLISSGDVCLFVLKDYKISYSYPFTTIHELNSDKGFLGTKKLLANEVLENTFYSSQFTLENNNSILLATDAIARYILTSQNIDVLKSSDFNEFKNYVTNLLENKVLEDDDITLIEITDLFNNKNEIKEIIPQKDCSSANNSLETLEMNSPTQDNKEIERQLEIVKSILAEFEHKIKNLNHKIKLLRISFFSILAIVILYTFFSILRLI